MIAEIEFLLYRFSELGKGKFLRRFAFIRCYKTLLHFCLQKKIMPCGCKHKKRRKRGSGMQIRGGSYKRRKRGGNFGKSSSTWTPKYLSPGPVRVRYKPGSGMSFRGGGMAFAGSGFGGMSWTGAGLGRRIFRRRGTGKRVI